MENDDFKSIESNEYSIDGKATVEKKNSELNNRINRLYGIENEQGISSESEKKYDPVELQSIRKKMMILLLILVLFMLLTVVVYLKPFEFQKGNKNENTNATTGGNISETKPPEDENLQQQYEKELEKLINNIGFNDSECLNIDLLPLYNNDILKAKDIPNDLKIYLMKKHSYFLETIVEQKLAEMFSDSFQGELIISVEDIDNVVKRIFGKETTIEHKTFECYISNPDYLCLTFEYKDGKYIVKMDSNDQPLIENISKFLQQQIIEAKKTETGIEIYQRVVFISIKDKIGVFKDSGFKTLITDDKTATSNDYINQGSLYKFTYVEDNGSYYLEQIELVKEGN